MTKVAAIDCGTNSIRLLVADADPRTGSLTDLDRRMRIVRLGQGVDRTGRLAPEALERTFAACREYADAVAAHGVSGIRFAATSASRDASNRDDFIRGVVDILGVQPEVITGDEEAALSFAGATRELPTHETVLVVDIGGGSTEFVLGDARVRAARSVDIGSVRLTERHLLHDGEQTDPPTADQIAAIRADVERALDQAAATVPLRESPTLVGLAGSVTTVGALALGLTEYDSTAVHRSRVSYEQVKDITRTLLTETHAERAAKAVIHPGRVDVIGTGALILQAIMERTSAAEVIVSEHDILDGIAWSVAEAAQ